MRNPDGTETNAFLLAEVEEVDRRETPADRRAAIKLLMTFGLTEEEAKAIS
jgi:hypothetical protein